MKGTDMKALIQAIGCVALVVGVSTVIAVGVPHLPIWAGCVVLVASLGSLCHTFHRCIKGN